jgi:hypothetical protein
MSIYLVFQRKVSYPGSIPAGEERVCGPYEAVRLEYNVLKAFLPDTINGIPVGFMLAHYNGDQRLWITGDGETWAAWFHYPKRHHDKTTPKQPKRQRVLLEEPDNGRTPLLES